MGAHTVPEGGALAATLFGQTRQRVLGLFFSQPNESFYLREVVRRTGAAQGAVQRELKALTDAGILTRTARGRHVDYTVNRACPVYPELQGLVMKTTGLVDVLRSALAPLAERIEVAFVFGSLAAGQARADSDVDLFVVGALGLGEVIDALGDVQTRLGREVNPVVQTRDEFQGRVARADHFVSGMLQRQKVFVIGDDRELERLATQRMADAPPDPSAGNRRPARHRRPRPAQQPG